MTILGIYLSVYWWICVFALGGATYAVMIAVFRALADHFDWFSRQDTEDVLCSLWPLLVVFGALFGVLYVVFYLPFSGAERLIEFLRMKKFENRVRREFSKPKVPKMRTRRR